MNLSIPDGIKSFTSGSGSDSFLESNGLIAKFGFILLVVIIFVALIRVAVTILNSIMSPKSDPILIDGMVDGRMMMSFPQDQSIKGSIPIIRSRNERGGIAFTWSVWLFIDDLTYGEEGEYKHIFHKGNPKIDYSSDDAGMNIPNNAPGLYLDKSENKLVAVMSTFDKIKEKVEINNIPMNKWFNVILRVNEQNKFDIYINGKLVKRHILSSVPKQNYEDVYVAMNGGISGNISSLRYYSRALGTFEIGNLIRQGPNIEVKGNDMSPSSVSKANYLSLNWFFYNNE